jgi:hypothetical protein
MWYAVAYRRHQHSPVLIDRRTDEINGATDLVERYLPRQPDPGAI